MRSQVLFEATARGLRDLKTVAERIAATGPDRRCADVSLHGPRTTDIGRPARVQRRSGTSCPGREGQSDPGWPLESAEKNFVRPLTL